MNHKIKGGSPWALSVEDILAVFQSRLSGITHEDAELRRKTHGENAIPAKKTGGPVAILVRQFASPLIFILIGAATVTMFLKEWVDAGVILLAVLVNAGLGFYQEFRAERVLEKLTTYIKERTRVLRGGIEQEIDSSLLVPGDIILLSYGARVPADARVLSENSFSLDESILTGESLPVHKTPEILSEGVVVAERKNMAFAGTLVIEGNATAIVTATGVHTEIGRIAKLVSKTSHEETPLQRGLGKLAWYIFAGISVLVAIMFAIGISRGEDFFEMLLISAAVAVGAIPEALPIVLTVILAVGVERIAKKKGIIRSLSAAETLGSATVIMTDKTGTLTEANMKLVGIASKEALLGGTPHLSPLDSLHDTQRVIMRAALASTYAIIENPDDLEKDWRYVGKPLEVNIARAARELGMNVREIISTRRAPYLPFNSTNKFAIGEDAELGVIVIGAPDILANKSELGKDAYDGIMASVQALSENGARLIGIGIPKKADADKIRSGSLKPVAITDIEFLGVLAFRDPLRADIKGALRSIEDLGVSVVMVTGDLKGTAVSVAREVGWDIAPGDVLTGEELKRLTDDELSAALAHVRIFARVTPEDKMRIALLFQKRGEVVAMTGDGVNDAPSLKAVDIGVALGSGSDVAKGVADLILLNDSFKTIVIAIEEGRRMILNIRKAFVYLLTNSLDEVFLVGGALIASLPLPLTALQIIWVNFATGGLPALAYAFEENRDRGSQKRKRDTKIFTTEVKVLTLGVGTVSSALLFALYWSMLSHGIPFVDAQSILFLCFACYVLIVAYSFKNLEKPLFSYPLFTNHYLNGSVLIAMSLIILTYALPQAREVFELGIPPTSLLWIVAVWLVANIGVVETAKWFFIARSKKPSLA